MTKSNSNDCYDHPRYWDLAFQDETEDEVEFFEEAFKKFATIPVRKLLEPGCGGGRLVVEMASRGYELTAFDLSQSMVGYVNQRLEEKKLNASVYVGDMTEFQLPASVDAVFNTMNTFRHLITEEAAKSHLQSVANCLNPGGIFILGFHIIPLDADEEDEESWTEEDGDTEVKLTLTVAEFDREKRQETLRFDLEVNDNGKQVEISSKYPYRLYTHDQFRSLLNSVPELELCEVFDFWYEIDHPVPFDHELSDAVFVLRKR
ncbi:MAG: class I SAM-dependent methyltransferase [Pirellulales bacterium]